MADLTQQACAIEDLRQMARRRLPRALFDFFDGGAEDEITLRANRAAFERHCLLPRVLVDVTQVDAATQVVGGPSSLPMAIAPTGAVGFGWPGGDVAIAKAAAAAGIAYTLSSSATASIERIAREAPGRLWFQAYVLRDTDYLHGLIERARAADYEGLMITLDLPVGGKRERDFRNHFSIPFRFTSRNLRDFAQHPRWALRIARHGMPVMENLSGLVRRPGSAAASASAVASFVGQGYDTAFDWDRLQRLRERWPRRLIVKGVAHPDDAVRLVRLGVDAIVVSNHGGRQLDGAAASLDLHARPAGEPARPTGATSMTSRPVAQLLVDLGVARSHSRPHVSNDNPYSEAAFKTLKYAPAFPTNFGSLADARVFCEEFFTYYNHEHRHSGIALHTPASVHYGTAAEIGRQRRVTLHAAYDANPTRFGHRRPEPPALPEAAWINQPSREALIQSN